MMNGKSISIVEFPKVRCPALVDVWSHAGAFSLGEIRMSSANQRREIRILSLVRTPHHSPRANSAFRNPKIGSENGHFAEIRAEIRRSTIGQIRHKTDAMTPIFMTPLVTRQRMFSLRAKNHGVPQPRQRSPTTPVVLLIWLRPRGSLTA